MYKFPAAKNYFFSEGLNWRFIVNFQHTELERKKKRFLETFKKYKLQISNMFYYPVLPEQPNRKLGEESVLPPHGIVDAGTEPWGIVMEAAIQDRASVHELSSQHICTRIVQPNTLKKSKQTSTSNWASRSKHWRNRARFCDIPCPRRIREGGRYDWRSGDWRSHLPEGSRAPGRLPGGSQLS